MRTYNFLTGVVVFIWSMKIPIMLPAQISSGSLHGNFQIDSQYYLLDSAIGAENIADKIRTNAFLNLMYNNGNFSAGVRYELYQKPLLGFDPRWEGQGLAFRYGRYESEFLDITVGNFYEQFGSGLILRSYEERQLGFDNTFDGIRLKVRPTKGLQITALVGKQRLFFNLGAGSVRAADIDLSLTSLIPSFLKNWTITLGGSIISKYQSDNDPIYRLPENVFAASGRLRLSSDSWNIESEYAYKVNDPSTVNKFSYNDGRALYLSIGYVQTGFSLTVAAKKVDNMDFRNDRTQTGTNGMINFLPAMTRQHTYRLITLYPYATQPTGEFALQGELQYSFPQHSLLGGQYGTQITVNYSRTHAPDTSRINEFLYNAPFWNVASRLYFQDFNLEVAKKWSESLKTTFTYINLRYDKAQIEGKPGAPMVNAHSIILENSISFSERNALRSELQWMGTQEDMGSWAFALLEYTIAPAWFFSIFDEFNYGNPDVSKRFHYLNGSVTYVHEAYRFALSFGRQRAGILCVGGICRVVPAANGITLSISGSF